MSLENAREDGELTLLDACAAIGRVAECNSHYTYRLALAAQATGRPIRQFTVGELLDLIEAETARYNADFGRKG